MYLARETECQRERQTEGQVVFKFSAREKLNLLYNKGYAGTMLIALFKLI